jgi:hypothetical protein
MMILSSTLLLELSTGNSLVALRLNTMLLKLPRRKLLQLKSLLKEETHMIMIQPLPPCMMMPISKRLTLPLENSTGNSLVALKPNMMLL